MARILLPVCCDNAMEHNQPIVNSCPEIEHMPHDTAAVVPFAVVAIDSESPLSYAFAAGLNASNSTGSSPQSLAVSASSSMPSLLDIEDDDISLLDIHSDSDTDSNYTSDAGDHDSSMSMSSEELMSDEIDMSDSDADSDDSDWLLKDMTKENTNRESDEYIPSSASSSSEPSATVFLPRRPITRKRKTPSASSSSESLRVTRKRVRRAVGGTLVRCEPLKKSTVGTMEEKLAQSITASLMPPHIATNLSYSRTIQHARNQYTPAKTQAHGSNVSA